MSERDSDGVTVAVWEHDLFVSTIRSRYLSSPEDKKKIHSKLADYFLGTWAGKKKPVEIKGPKPDEVDCFGVPVVKKVQLPCGESADRLVPMQPLTYPQSAKGAPVSYRFVYSCNVHVDQVVH